MRISLLVTVALLALTVFRTQAALVYYTSQSAFDAVTPGLPLDTFSGAGVATGPYSNMAGVSVTTVEVSTNNLTFHGGITPNYFGDTLVLNFSPAITAAGVYVEGEPASGQNGPNTQLISDVYLTGSSNPTETTPSIPTNTPYFFGVTSSTPITSLHFLFDYQAADAFTVVPSVEFGNTPEPASTLLFSLPGLLLLRRRASR